MHLDPVQCLCDPPCVLGIFGGVFLSDSFFVEFLSFFQKGGNDDDRHETYPSSALRDADVVDGESVVASHFRYFTIPPSWKRHDMDPSSSPREGHVSQAFASSLLGPVVSPHPSSFACCLRSLARKAAALTSHGTDCSRSPLISNDFLPGTVSASSLLLLQLIPRVLRSPCQPR